jgi:hypothetical protein
MLRAAETGIKVRERKQTWTFTAAATRATVTKESTQRFFFFHSFHSFRLYTKAAL